MGAVYVYVKSGGGWSGNLTEAAKLTASDGAANDYFGAAVAVSGDGNLIVVGARGHDSSKGQIYLFHKPAGGWSGNLTENVKLKVAGGLTGDGLGGALAISGDASAIVAGASGVDVNSRSGQGAAYVFVAPFGGWPPGPNTLFESAKLLSWDGAASDAFGSSTAIDGDVIVVGASGKNIGQGAAYVFIKPGGGWSSTVYDSAKLRPLSQTQFDYWEYFGTSVAISGDSIIVGSPLDNSDLGNVYVYVKPGGGWAGTLTETAKLWASDRAIGDELGYSVAIAGDVVLASAFADDVGNNASQGSTYLYVKPQSGWSGDVFESTKLTAADGAGGDWFGSAVAMSSSIVIGAENDDAARGSAYVFANDCTAKPSKPFLKQPLNGATVSTNRPTLKWLQTPCAGFYNVTVKDAATGKKVDSANQLADLSYKVKQLPGGRTFKWFVQACNIFGCTKSATRTFTKP